MLLMRKLRLGGYMSKTSAWYMTMQEDAGDLTKDEFIKKHGENIIEKTVKKFCLMYGSSNLIRLPKNIIFKELDIS